MNRALQCVLLAIVGLVAVAAVPGIRVTDRIVPSSTNDTYPTHEAQWGRGGWRSVTSTADRDAIPAARREAGMIVYVEESRVPYTLLPGLTNWARLGGHANDITQFGAIGDNATDCIDAIEAALAVTNHLEIPPGRYLISRPLKLPNARPLSIRSGIGAYQGGWVSTNDVGEAELVYVGPSTNVAFDFTPTVGWRYGLRIEGVSFNANGRADVCVKLRNAGRYSLERPRIYGATGVQLLVDSCNFGTLDTVSTSVNDETPTPHPGAMGIVLTNWTVVTTIINPIVESGTNWGLVLIANCWNNFITGGASEKLGGGIKFEDNCWYNAIDTHWQETNSIDVPWLSIGTNCMFNRFSGIYQNEAGKVDVHGNYNKFSACRLGRVTLFPNASHNMWENIILKSDGSWDDQTGGSQHTANVINAAATWRTNTFPDSITFYGEELKLWSSTQTQPRALWNRSGIYFGDGTNSPTSGFTRISEASLMTPNTLAFQRSGANDGLWYAYLPGDTYGRVRLNLNSQLDFGPGGASDYDTFIRRGGPRVIDTESMWSVVSTNLWDIFGGRLTGDSANRTTMRVNGEWQLGSGSAVRDLAVGRATNGVLYVQGALDLVMTNSPPAPPAGWGRLRVLSDGSKGRLVIVWPSGATNTIATEP